MKTYYTLHALTLGQNESYATNEHVTSDFCFKAASTGTAPLRMETINQAQWLSELAARHHDWIKSMFALKHAPGQDPVRIELVRK